MLWLGWTHLADQLSENVQANRHRTHYHRMADNPAYPASAHPGRVLSATFFSCIRITEPHGLLNRLINQIWELRQHSSSLLKSNIKLSFFKSTLSVGLWMNKNILFLPFPTCFHSPQLKHVIYVWDDTLDKHMVHHNLHWSSSVHRSLAPNKATKIWHPPKLQWFGKALTCNLVLHVKGATTDCHWFMDRKPDVQQSMYIIRQQKKCK